MDYETIFIELFQRLVEREQLSPEIAEELLYRILEILSNSKIEDIQRRINQRRTELHREQGEEI